MSQTLSTLLPWLNTLAGGGGGIVASWFFDQIRSGFPMDDPYTPPWLNGALYAPRYARLSVLLLSAVISVLASVAVAIITTGDWPGALDAAFATALSGVASQIWHGRTLPTNPPPPPTIMYIGKPRPGDVTIEPEMHRTGESTPTPFIGAGAYRVSESEATRREERHGSAGPVFTSEPFEGVNHGINVQYDATDRRKGASDDLPYAGPDRRLGSRAPENKEERPE